MCRAPRVLLHIYAAFSRRPQPVFPELSSGFVFLQRHSTFHKRKLLYNFIIGVDPARRGFEPERQVEHHKLETPTENQKRQRRRSLCRLSGSRCTDCLWAGSKLQQRQFTKNRVWPCTGQLLNQMNRQGRASRRPCAKVKLKKVRQTCRTACRCLRTRVQFRRLHHT